VQEIPSFSLWNKSCQASTAFDRIQIKLKRFKQFFKGWGSIDKGKKKGEVGCTRRIVAARTTGRNSMS